MSQFGAEYDAILASVLNPTESLAQSKAKSLAVAKQNKLNTITPPTPDYNAMYEEMYGNASGAGSPEGFMGADVGNPNLIDATQASLYKTAQGVAKLPFKAASGLAGMLSDDAHLADEIDVTQDWATDEGINKFFGHDPSITQNKIGNVVEAYDRGDVVDTAVEALKAVPNVLADSSGEMVGLLAGGTGLLGGIAKTANKANKALKAEQALVKKVAKQDIATTKAGTGYRMQTLKDSLEARKALGAKIASNEDKAKTFNTLDKLIRVNKGSVAIGLSMASEQYEEFKKNNNGEGDIGRFIASAGANIALLGIEFNILKGIGKGVLKDMAIPMAKDTLIAALKGNTTGLVKALFKNSAKIAGAAGAEAAQEYAQTWTEILTKQADTTKFGSLDDVISDEANQKEANIASILGAASGGSLRAAPTVVKAPITAATATASKVIRKTADYGVERAINASYELLSVDEREQLKAQFEAEDANIEKSNATRQTQIDKITEATTIEELRELGDDKINEAIDNTLGKSKIASKIVETIDKVTGTNTLEGIAKLSAHGQVLIGKLSKEDKSNPDTVETIKEQVLENLNGRLNKNESSILSPRVETIKNAAIAQYNKDIDITKATNTFTKGKDIVQRVATNAYEKAKAKGQELVDAIPQEAVDKVVELINDGKELTTETVETVISELKGIDKSVARALLDDLVSDKPTKATVTALTKLNIETLGVLEKALKSNPKALRKVKAAKDRKIEIRNQFFGDDAKITTVIKKAKAAGKKIMDKLKGLVNEDTATKVKGLKSILVSSINDSETLKDLSEFVDDIKTDSEGLASESAEFLDSFKKEIKAKGEELKKKGEEEVKKEKEEKKTAEKEAIANRDFATMSRDELGKISKNFDEFIYSLSEQDVKDIEKNKNLKKVTKESIRNVFNDMVVSEKAEITKTGDTKSTDVDTLLDDEFVKQAQDEEGCK